jgi:hypothetical protein
MSKVRLILLSLLALLFASCEKDGVDTTLTVGPFGEETRKVLLFYEAGFNNLSGNLAGNIASLKEGYLPEKNRNDDVLLVFTHNTKSYGNYKTDTSPVLVRFYSERGEVRTDTLKTWPAGASIANAAMVTDVFNWVKEEFPAASYGAVMASHASGWLPEGYYDKPERYEGYNRGGSSWSWAPRRKSFGHEYFSNGTMTEEIEIKDLAKAIPYKLDYLVFDACLMATVEVAWELRDVCSYLVVSPCETPAAGFDYKGMAARLLKPETPDPKGVAQDYFAAYENDSLYGATITVVDCGALDPLASVCSTLFDRYRSGIQNLTGSNVQVYDRSHGKKYYYAFFDLKDMLREAGATEEDLASLQKALDKAIVYEAHTKQFITVKLDRCCGLSMYLPAYPDYKKDLWHGTEFLDNFYKQNLSWNAATHLVE